MKGVWFCIFILMAYFSTCWAIPAQIIIIRHAEKLPLQKDLSLAQKGKERAAAYAPYFLGDPHVLEFGPPVAIYTQQPSRAFDTLRPIETVEPLAKALNIELTTNFKSDEYLQMLREVMIEPAYNGKMVLICWQRYAIPSMVETLGIVSAPKEWPDRAFDRNWLITFKAREGPHFRNMPQRLMYGDSEH